MKKFVLVLVLFVGVSTLSKAQSAGGSGAEKVSGEKKKKVRGESKSGARKPRKQLVHFKAKAADPNIKSNGTSHRMKRKKKVYSAEGSGF